jgi:hypothetical protein
MYFVIATTSIQDLGLRKRKGKQEKAGEEKEWNIYSKQLIGVTDNSTKYWELLNIICNIK